MLRSELTAFLDAHPDIRFFIRMHPIWYARLSRDPTLIQPLKAEVDDFYGRSFKKRVEKFGEQLNMVNLLMDLAQTFGPDTKSQEEPKP